MKQLPCYFFLITSDICLGNVYIVHEIWYLVHFPFIQNLSIIEEKFRAVVEND